jgi:sRNA-binding protein
MTKTARRARIPVIIELLCERFPQTFNRGGPQPLKVGIYHDALAALNGAAAPRDLKSALQAYTSNTHYLRRYQQERAAWALTANLPAL